MAIAECAQGHLYDPNIYASCPYCNGGANMINFDQPGKTAAPAGYGPQSTPAPFYPAAPVDYAPAPAPEVSYRPAEEVGKTVAPESYRKRQEEENRTVGTFKKKYDLEPVVGWIACIDGPDKGSSYELYAKINTIGRSSENDVCIKGDGTISKKGHARLAYDHKHNNFQLIPGESTNNIYRNDEPIYVPVKLEAYDVVEFGQSKLIFVPLCCDHFRWETAEEA